MTTAANRAKNQRYPCGSVFNMTIVGKLGDTKKTVLPRLKFRCECLALTRKSNNRGYFYAKVPTGFYCPFYFVNFRNIYVVLILPYFIIYTHWDLEWINFGLYKLLLFFIVAKEKASRKARIFFVLDSFNFSHPRTTNDLSYREAPAFRKCRNDNIQAIFINENIKKSNRNLIVCGCFFNWIFIKNLIL